MKKQSQSLKNRKLWKQTSSLMREAHPSCEVCGKTTSLQVHHLVKKYYHKSLLRFTPENLIVVCGKCHFNFHSNPICTIEWFQRNRFEDYNKILNKLGRII